MSGERREGKRDGKFKRERERVKREGVNSKEKSMREGKKRNGKSMEYKEKHHSLLLVSIPLTSLYYSPLSDW